MITAVLLSGGTGTRLNMDIPKQYIEVNGKPLIHYAIKALVDNDEIEKIQVVAEDSWRALIKDEIISMDAVSKLLGFSNPGANRQLSILNALRDMDGVMKPNDYVIIQDAARPMTSQDLYRRLIEGVKGHDGALPVIDVKDTMYMTDTEGRIASLLERDFIKAGQAPEIFIYGRYLEANEKLLADNSILGIRGSSEPAVMNGMDIITILGDEMNFKITTMADLERFKELTGDN